jgi:glycosyltransferase involved in cell wall biosynthesis
LPRPIESVLGRTCPTFEIIVLDDGSTDDTSEVIGRFGDRVKYLLQENNGVSAARSRGVAESDAKLIAFLDSDDTWELLKIEKRLAKVDTESEIGLVHCEMREFDSETGMRSRCG